jgi:PAS domain S-box-containing protein
METSHAIRLPVVASLKLRFYTAILASFMLVACYLAAELSGILVISIPEGPWPLWLGCAVLVAILLLSPKKIWLILIPAGLAGFVLYDVHAGVSIRSITWLILADICEILVAASGVMYLLHGLPRLDSLRAFAKYALAAVVLGPLVASLIGIEAMHGNRWINFWVAFLSEGLAFLTVVPAIVGCVDHFRTRRPVARAYYLEAAALIAALISLSYVVFVARATKVPPALLYSLVPFLLWSGFRFGSAGTGSAASIVTLVSLWGAVHGRGPFTEIEPVNRVFSLQLFLLCTALPFMVLAVLAEERRRQESVLRESEQRFRLLADHSPTMIWMSGTDKLCTFFNRGWLNFTGRSMEQELGDGWASGVHPDDQQRCLRLYSVAFDSREDFEIEYRLCRYDGEYRWIVDYGVPRFGANGAFCGYVGSCVDITERKLSEISLRELTGRLIHAQEKERSRIARELHDDIGQRMALLQIGLEQFEQSSLALAPNDHKQLKEITAVASEISSDLHNISRQLHPARLDLLGLVGVLSSFCRELSNRHELQVTFRHRDIPAQIPKDVALCLFRVVQEGLRNVMKHAETSAATVELSTDADVIDLCISDSGTGFSFESVKGKGGLGLISMSERLRLIGGHLTVESEPLHGTRIRARVPLSSRIGQSSNGADRLSAVKLQ